MKTLTLNTGKDHKKMRRKNIITALLFTFFSLIAFKGVYAQNDQLQEVLDSAAVEEQFNYIFERSSRYEEYKVIRENWLIRYRQSLNDTINKLRRELSDNEKLIASKNEEIQSLNNTLEETEEQLKTAVKERNSLNLLGIKMDKTFYNLIMWIIIAALAVFLVIVFLMYKRSHAITRDATSKYEKLQKEHEEYRNNSRLKIEKLKREHLDEILKLKGNK